MSRALQWLIISTRVCACAVTWALICVTHVRPHQTARRPGWCLRGATVSRSDHRLSSKIFQDSSASSPSVYSSVWRLQISAFATQSETADSYVGDTANFLSPDQEVVSRHRRQRRLRWWFAPLWFKVVGKDCRAKEALAALLLLTLKWV